MSRMELFCPFFRNLVRSRRTSRWVVKLDFVGANPNPRIAAADPTPAVISYFNGPKENWKAGLPTYGSIVYSDLWPGVDLVYSGTVNRFKYTFLVKPGADPAQVKLAYRGAHGVRVSDVGLGIAVDSSGNAYVTGSTTSTQATFPVTVGPDLTLNGGVNAFAAKIGANGAPGGGDATAALLPSSARAPGAGGAFFTTDLTVSSTGASNTTFTLKFLGHDQNGTGGSEQTFALAAGKTATYTNVLGSVRSLSSGFGGIRIVSPALNIMGQTSTPGFGGTFGQSVPASAPEDLIVSDTPLSLVAVREDAAFRANVILCNTTSVSLDVDAVLIAAGGQTLASKRYTLAPLGMTQATRVVRDMGVAGDVPGARLLLSTPTSGGAFAAYASAIDNSTNDPRTLLAK